MRVVSFFVLRFWFAVACRAVTASYRFGAAPWFVNSVGAMLGSRLSCRLLLRLGWRPVDSSRPVR